MPEEWISDFVACMDDPTGENLQIDKAFMIKYRHLPDRLFKFRGVTDYAIANLDEGTVWVTSPSNYNDPYDCAATISVKKVLSATPPADFDLIVKASDVVGLLSPEQVEAAKQSDNPIRFISRALLEREKQVDPAKIDEMLEVLDRAQEEVTGKYLRETLEGIRESVKICSFCTILTPITMWSHYGDEHKGFCMEYNVRSMPENIKRMLFPVIYQPELFDLTKYIAASIRNAGSFNNIYASLQALYKSPDWEYEKEWRLAIIGGVIPQPQNVYVGHPSKVHLGARMSSEDRDRVINSCRQNHVPVGHMKLSPDRFELISEDIII